MRIAVLIAAVLGAASVHAASPGKNETPATIVLTAQENGRSSQTEFLCLGKIHGYLRFPSRQLGAHTLESDWIRPDGAVEAQGHADVDFRPARSTAYVWFDFPERPALGMPDPELDARLASYAGTWHLRVRWDGQALLDAPFSVRCPS